MSIKIVFFDCDGTLTNVKSSWQYLHERLDLWDSNADEFQRLFRAGDIDYREFCRRDAALWKGLPEEQVRLIAEEIPYREGVRETARTLKSEGIPTVIISTGLTLLVNRVQRELEMTFAVANELIVQDGVVTGDIRINVDHDHGHSEGPRPSAASGEVRDKAYWVKSLLQSMGFRKEEAAAVGDGEGDRRMFGAVGLAIGYHPSATVLPFLDHALHNGSFSAILDLLRARP